MSFVVTGQPSLRRLCMGLHYACISVFTLILHIKTCMKPSQGFRACTIRLFVPFVFKDGEQQRVPPPPLEVDLVPQTAFKLQSGLLQNPH